MFPTAARLSKASRAPLTPKRGNKDFYKGTRQAFLPGGHRTGAPGKHVIGGKAKYRLLDEKVRVYVAPPIQEIESTKLKPYVPRTSHLTPDESTAVWGRFKNAGGITPQHFLKIARQHSYAREHPEAPSPDAVTSPTWMGARVRLGMMPNPNALGVAVPGAQPVAGVARPAGRNVKELEVVEPRSTAAS